MTSSTKKASTFDSLSDDALIHLKSYKYSSVDKSLLSYYILNPFWNASVKLLPMWLAPNMVTLIGFFFILANVGLLLIFMPDLVGPGPSWLYYSFALGLFLYQTMDNLDGKQARRTGTSSGLGELFDHGIDSLNCTLASLLETAAMGLGTSKSGVFTALCPCLPMFFSTWETYHSHTLYLGIINGPTEGLLIASAIMATSGFYGPGIWTEQPLVDLLLGGEARATRLLGPLSSLLLPLASRYSFRDIWIALIAGSLVVSHIPFCIYHVVLARQAQGLPVAPVFLEWTPMVVYTLSIGAWLYSPYSTLRSENHLVLFCMTMSFVFGRMTTKMILAHLTRQPFPYWTVMLTPLVGGAVLANLPRIGVFLALVSGGSDSAISAATSHLWQPISAQAELSYLLAYFFFAMTVYFRWAYVVINSICSFLGINALTIPMEKQLETQRRLRGEKPHSNGSAANGKKLQ